MTPPQYLFRNKTIVHAAGLNGFGFFNQRRETPGWMPIFLAREDTLLDVFDDSWIPFFPGRDSVLDSVGPSEVW